MEDDYASRVWIKAQNSIVDTLPLLSDRDIHLAAQVVVGLHRSSSGRKSGPDLEQSRYELAVLAEGARRLTDLGWEGAYWFGRVLSLGMPPSQVEQLAWLDTGDWDSADSLSVPFPGLTRLDSEFGLDVPSGLKVWFLRAMSEAARDWLQEWTRIVPRDLLSPQPRPCSKHSA